MNDGNDPIASTPPVIGAVLAEAAILARDLEDTPLWRIANVREGAITIQQQAERYAAADDDVTRRDAAAWAREGYVLLSSALPDTYESELHDERSTGWLTAADISRLFGPEDAWLERVRLAFAPSIPE